MIAVTKEVRERLSRVFGVTERTVWGALNMEVENHLMSQWRESFLRAGVLFPFVRFCAPMNSQEKSAEAFNGAHRAAVGRRPAPREDRNRETARHPHSPMTRRAYSPREVVRRTYRTIEWGEPWRGPFGHPVWTETWFVSGQSASGKSSFVMQLCKELCRHAGVLYVSLEEGVSQSFKARMERFRMTEVQGAFRVFCMGRYTEDPGSSYVVWEEGVMRTTNNIG